MHGFQLPDVGVVPVQCNYASPSGSSIWVSGTVVALWYREKSWPETKYCPYQVKLDSRVIPKEQAKSGMVMRASKM